MSHMITSKLSISSKKLTNCHEVIELLYQVGIPCKVVETESVVKQTTSRGNPYYIKEPGCEITLCGVDPNKIYQNVWKPLQTKFELGCGHLQVGQQFSGCIYRYVQPYQCPKPKHVSQESDDIFIVDSDK